MRGHSQEGLLFLDEYPKDMKIKLAQVGDLEEAGGERRGRSLHSTKEAQRPSLGETSLRDRYISP